MKREIYSLKLYTKRSSESTKHDKMKRNLSWRIWKSIIGKHWCKLYRNGDFFIETSKTILNTKHRKRKDKETLTEKWRDLWRKGTHKHKKLNWNILTITDAFLDQKRVNVPEHTAKMESTLMWHRRYYVFTYIYSLLIKKDICDHQNISIKLRCVCVCLSSGNLFIFW